MMVFKCNKIELCVCDVYVLVKTLDYVTNCSVEQNGSVDGFALFLHPL
jgi:hypothetical protein